MDELSIRRGRGIATTRMMSPGKTEAAEKARQTGTETIRTEKEPDMLSVDLQRLMKSLSQEAELVKSDRSLLRQGESALAETRESLEKIADVFERAASGGDTGALQKELDGLMAELDRVLTSAGNGKSTLFTASGGDAALNGALLEGLEGLIGGAESTGNAALPAWISLGMKNASADPKLLLAQLGLSENATAREVLAAVAERGLDDPAAAAIATLYVGAVISGVEMKEATISDMVQGMRELLTLVSRGVSPDEALKLLTNGEYSSFSEIEALFAGGDANATLLDFMTALLSRGGGLSDSDAMFLMLAGGAGAGDGLLSGLMDMLGSGNAEAVIPEGFPIDAEVVTFGPFHAAGDTSGLSFDTSTGVLTVSGSGDVFIAGDGTTAGGIVVSGTGGVMVTQLDAGFIRIESPEAHLSTFGENIAGSLILEDGASAELSGTGLLDLGAVRGGKGTSISITGGAVQVDGGDGAVEANVAVTVAGAASFSARAIVTDASGARLTPVDLVWRTLLPGFSAITSISVNGAEAKLALFNNGSVTDLARLWLRSTDTKHDRPVYSVVIEGRDGEDKPVTRYAYLRWDERRSAFVEVENYPNPFSVTGGEEGVDWLYDEYTQTVRILTDTAMTISGGAGVTADEEPFCGRVSVDDRVGDTTITLAGVRCEVNEGRAFYLGRENDVTVSLSDGSENILKSGAGYAGLSVGDGSSLVIEREEIADDEPTDVLSRMDREPKARGESGRLSCTAGDGGAGIGRDSGKSRDRVSSIRIKSGVVEAVGAGGGAGIGAGKHGYIGDIIITGGTVTAAGERLGGAGIGGALGAPAGNITIRGGRISARAYYHAAAIGAGVEGECGDVTVEGTAVLAGVAGADIGADIGAGMFGRCGAVRVAPNIDTGGASVTMKAGGSVTLHLGGAETAMFPRFDLSSDALVKHKLSVMAQDNVAAQRIIMDDAVKQVARIESAYHSMCLKMEEGVDRIAAATGLLRSEKDAGAALEKAKRQLLKSSAEALKLSSRRVAEDVLKLLR